MDDIKGIVKEVNKDNLMDTVRWLTENTPYRMAGSEDERKASEYVSMRMREYGIDVVNEEFYTYNSNPAAYSKVEITSPITEEVQSLPCAHIKETGEEGEEFDLIYIGDGSYSSYDDIDARGKAVLVEVSYAPPVPEKARIAYEMGAAGIICMNWGNDEEVICHRALKAVWGNPTEETVANIPDIVGIGVTRNTGLKLKELCLSGENVRVKITAKATREWSKVHQPRGILRGNGKPDQFLLVSSHLDAWKPGVTCNATGNATTLELCRILSKHRDKLDRDIYFVFWNGHEIAEAAGSTWFVDNYWDILNKKCVGYINIDSTGVSGTKLFEIKASDELLNFAVDNFNGMAENTEIRAMSLRKIGDQSFMGIGIPAVTQRMSFTQEDMDKAHGATLGWWNHTKEDGVDKCDPDILVTDTEVTLSLIYKLAATKILPYMFKDRLEVVIKNMNLIAEKYGEHMSFSDLLQNLDEARNMIVNIQENAVNLDCEKQKKYNQFLLITSRLITNVFQTYSDKYQQDSYGYTKLSGAIPLFADLKRLEALNKDSFEYGMLHTQLIKNKNRINDSLKILNDFADLYSEILGTRM